MDFSLSSLFVCIDKEQDAVTLQLLPLVTELRHHFETASFCKPEWWGVRLKTLTYYHSQRFSCVVAQNQMIYFHSNISTTSGWDQQEKYF